MPRAGRAVCRDKAVLLGGATGRKPLWPCESSDPSRGHGAACKPSPVRDATIPRHAKPKPENGMPRSDLLPKACLGAMKETDRYERQARAREEAMHGREERRQDRKLTETVPNPMS